MARGRERAALVLLCALTSVVALLAVARTFLDGEVADAGVLSLLLICYLAIFAWVLRRLQRFRIVGGGSTEKKISKKKRARKTYGKEGTNP